MKTNIFRLRKSKSAHATLDALAERCDRLWNAGNYLCRQRFIKAQGVPGYSELCRLLPKQYPKDYAALPSDIAQEMLKKLAEAWKSFFQLQYRFKMGKLPNKPGLVRYRKCRAGAYPKDYIPVKGPRSYGLSRSTLSLPLPADLRTKGRLVTAIQGNARYRGKSGRLELSFDPADRCWRATVSVETPERAFRQNGRAAAIDLGMRVAASLSIEGQADAHHFRGRELMKEFQYWTRCIAAHQQALSKRKLKTSRQLLQLYQTRRRRLEHALRATAKAIAGLCRASKVGLVYIGWPKGIRDDVKVHKDWRGRLHNYWNFNRFGQILIDALDRQGILGKLVGERGTSSTCPWTLDRTHKMSRSPRWRLTCKDCGKAMHSDAAGSGNILAFNKPGLIRDGAKAAPTPRTHAWNSHAWRLRENHSLTQELLAA
jgi:transposase